MATKIQEFVAHEDVVNCLQVSIAVVSSAAWGRCDSQRPVAARPQVRPGAGHRRGGLQGQHVGDRKTQPHPVAHRASPPPARRLSARADPSVGAAADDNMGRSTCRAISPLSSASHSTGTRRWWWPAPPPAPSSCGISKTPKCALPLGAKLRAA